MRIKKVAEKFEINNVLELPSKNNEMEFYIKNNKINLMEQTIDSIEFAVKHNLPFVEVFKFNNSDFVITISEKEYLLNIEHIFKSYIDSEKYELCLRVKKLQSLLKYLNEKEIEINTIIN